MTATPILDFYSAPSHAVVDERFTAQLDEVGDVKSLAERVSQLVVYDMVASEFYDLHLPDGRAEEIHMRSTGEMLRRLDAVAPVGLSARSAENRLVGRCHHYTRLMVELLRATGVPARARCGFGAYFNPSKYEDHWVCEYWDADGERWRLVDAQFDDVWRQRMSFEFDTLDVPRDKFVVAADAWQMCRRGDVDPELFGISFASFFGLWFVAGNLVHDVAALNRVQMLPWDVWGARPMPGHELSEEDLSFFDQLAELTRDPDSTFDELRRAYAEDDRLTVPSTVFNALRDRPESVPEPEGRVA